MASYAAASFHHASQWPMVHTYKTLNGHAVTLKIRQEATHGCCAVQNKEKGRKAIDPPPILELMVNRAYDPGQDFLTNPFLFCQASLVHAERDENGAWVQVPCSQIVGSSVSSLHKVKDMANNEGGFFIFPDISCRRVGNFRVQFTVFDLDKTANHAVHVASIVSNPFPVVPLKDFQGLLESTVLSRSFSEQGVKMRLRKEPRTLKGKGTKRGRSETADEPMHGQTQSGIYGGPVHGPVHGNGMFPRGYENDSPLVKRQRSSSDHTFGSNSSQQSGGGTNQYRGWTDSGPNGYIWSSNGYSGPGSTALYSNAGSHSLYSSAGSHSHSSYSSAGPNAMYSSAGSNAMYSSAGSNTLYSSAGSNGYTHAVSNGMNSTNPNGYNAGSNAYTASSTEYNASSNGYNAALNGYNHTMSNGFTNVGSNGNFTPAPTTTASTWAPQTEYAYGPTASFRMPTQEQSEFYDDVQASQLGQVPQTQFANGGCF